MAATKAPEAADVERRKKVRLLMRKDLAIAPQKYEGRTYYVVKDPVSMRYYRFKEQEHFLIGLMDGSFTLDEVEVRSAASVSAVSPDWLMAATSVLRRGPPAASPARAGQ